MASLAESSVASAAAECVQLQNLILQQGDHGDFTSSPSKAAAEDCQEYGRSRDVVVVKDTEAAKHSFHGPEAANSTNESSEPPLLPSSRPPPRLSPSKSAPAGHLDAMMAPLPEHHASAEANKASSFHGYPGGDTQVMGSQVYLEYMEALARGLSPTPVKAVLHVDVSPDRKINTYDTTVTDRSAHTCQEGETGYVDLVGAWQPTSPNDRSVSDVEDLLISPQTELRTSSQPPRMAAIATPSMAGHKRNSDGDLLTSAVTTAKKTPGFSQLFGPAQTGLMMSASQLFAQTQLPSSPLLDAPRSDPVMTRPSPNMHDRISTSSPPSGALSSPVLQMHQRPVSSANDPRVSYRSVRESQERRQARFRQGSELAAVGEDSEEEDVSQQRRLEQSRMRRVMSDEALSSWTRLSAPPRSTSRPLSKRKDHGIIDLVTPAPTRKGGPVEIETPADDDTDDEILLDDDDEAAEHEPSQNDVYDELGQVVLPSPEQGADDGDGQTQDGEPPCDGDDVEDQQTNDEIQNQSLPDTQQQDAAPEEPNSQLRVAGTPPAMMVDNHGRPCRYTQRLAGSQSNVGHRSSLSSFVPGSQYAGRTSQEQTSLSASQLRKPTLADTTIVGTSQRLPSSPPLAPSGEVAEGIAIAHTEEERPASRGSLPHNSADPSQSQEKDSPGHTDLDRVQSDGPEIGPSNGDEATNKTTAQSNPLFSTAQTHLSASERVPRQAGSLLKRSPSKMLASQQSLQSDSPRRAAGVRLFADIANDPTPPQGSSGMDVDVDVLISNVMTADDQQFVEAMSSPPSERVKRTRRLTQRLLPHGLRSSSPAITRNGVVNDNTELPKGSDARNALSTDGEASPSRTRRQNFRSASPAALRNSPSKANERVRRSAAKEPATKLAQEALEKQEIASAKVVSQLLSGRTRGENAQLDQGPRKNGKPSVKGKLPRRKRPSAQAVPDTHEDIGEPARHTTESVAPADAVPTTDVDNAVTHEHLDTGAVQAEPTVTEAAALPCTAPHRVMALFKGSYNNFYPAAWLGTNADGTSYRVLFDDRTLTDVDVQSVRRLDLRVGDPVKVDVQGMRNKSWAVTGFGPPVADAGPAETDAFGRSVVTLQARSRRASLAAAATVEPDGESFEALVTNIYVTHTMWPHFADRAFVPPQQSLKISARAETPVTGLCTPMNETPPSRSRRLTITAGKARASHLREGSVISSDSKTTNGIFAGMAFAISYGTNEAEKINVTKQIERNGGVIIRDTFEELFERIGLDAPPIEQGADDVATTKLTIRPEYQHLGFVALIADKHSRRAKYMQALALGLPILSGRWIIDCLKQNKPDSPPVPWIRYLLAAGESSYLNGAVRSRILSPQPASDAKVVTTIANRDVLLHGDGVLIVASKKSKATWDRRKTYAFLTLALGAGRVRRVADLDEAKVLLAEDAAAWSWVYVDGAVSEASAKLLKAGGAGAKKRKRGDESVGPNAMSRMDGKVRIVDDEFVVQSLILGALVD